MRTVLLVSADEALRSRLVQALGDRSVFFAGSDGSTAAPGHVGLVIGRHQMIEAYATGYPVRISAFGDSAAAPGDGDPVGFTRPWAPGGG